MAVIKRCRVHRDKINLWRAYFVVQYHTHDNHGKAQWGIIIFQDLTDLECIASELEVVTKLYDTLQSVMDWKPLWLEFLTPNGKNASWRPGGP